MPLPQVIMSKFSLLNNVRSSMVSVKEVLLHTTADQTIINNHMIIDQKRCNELVINSLSKGALPAYA